MVNHNFQDCAEIQLNQYGFRNTHQDADCVYLQVHGVGCR